MYEEIKFEELAPWAVLILTLAGGLLRVFAIGSKGMWLDETFSVWMASHSPSEMLQWLVRIDQHPPLYYLVLHAWMGRYGQAAAQVRTLSALFGAGAIPIIYLIGKRLSGVKVGLAAAVLLAFSPLHVYYAQETRMYTLLTFNAAAAIYALARLLTDERASLPVGRQLRAYQQAWRTAGPDEPAPEDGFSYQAGPPQSGWRAWLYRHRLPPIQAVETDLAWLALVVFTAATLLSHNTAVLFLLAINLFVFGLIVYQSRIKPGAQPALQAPSLGNWVKAQIGILILWSPWIVPFFKQASQVDRRFWLPKPTGEIVAQTVRSLLNASAPGVAFQTVMLWVMMLLLGLGLIYYRKKLAIFIFLACLAMLPFLGELLVSLRRPIFYERTLIWITVPALLLLAAGIVQLKYRPVMLLVLGIIAANYLFSAGDYFRFYQKEDWYTPAGYISLFSEPGDLILFNSNFVEIPFNYYFQPYEERHALQVEKLGVPLDLFASGVPEPLMTAEQVPGADRPAERAQAGLAGVQPRIVHRPAGVDPTDTGLPQAVNPGAGI